VVYSWLSGKVVDVVLSRLLGMVLVTFLLTIGGWTGRSVYRAQRAGAVMDRLEVLESIVAHQIPMEMDAMIDRRLRVHSKDTLALADFALLRMGAFPITKLTSRSPSLRSLPRRFSGTYKRKHATQMMTNSAELALDPDIQPGSCWLMEASTGYLGVALPFPVLVSNVTVDHIAWELVSHVRDAPRSVVVWGLIENVSPAFYHAPFLSKLQPPKAAVDLAISFNPNSTFMELARLEYDWTQTSSHIQSVPVRSVVVETGIAFEIVILEVKSNWGAERTCLYRFRVHGQEASQEHLSAPVALSQL